MTNTATSEAIGLESLVANVADEYRERQLRGERPTIDEYADRYPHAADLLRQVLSTFELLELSFDADSANVDGTQPAGTLGDFRLIRELGRGGMGVVYEALQISLNRRVALKVLPFAATMDPKHLQRFRNEAMAAASLRHENIVHVYGVGCERSVHFYAMEMIDGQTLAQIIAGLHQAPERNGATSDYQPADAAAPTAPVGALSTEFNGIKGRELHRLAARLIADAADALEHAHSLGIVHRDIKPGNLMVDADGKVYVTDFGLARFVPPPSKGGVGEGLGLTMSGDLLGTLKYMSPEQALARHGLVDHRTDVYSLGATLYELLTLRPAVDGADKAEILKAIAFEEPVALRKIDRAIPVELETITLKCVAKNPNERYATAKEMADDLRHWLDDKPIKAKPPGMRERSRKWMRRHQTLVRMSIAMLMLAVVGLGLSTWLIWKEKEAVRLAKAEVEVERDRAAKARDRTFEALDAMTSSVAGVSLETQSAISAEQKEFLTHMLGYYQEIVSEQAEALGTRKRIAAAATRVALILHRLGDREASSAACEQALSAFGKLTTEFPDVPEFRYQMSVCEGHLGMVSYQLAKWPEAEAAYTRAMEIQRRLVSDFPDEPSYRKSLAGNLGNLGLLFREIGKWPDAETAFRQAIAIRDKLAVDYSAVPEHRATLATSHINLGTLSSDLGNWKGAEASYSLAVTLAGKLVSEFPHSSEYRHTLAKSQVSLGSVQRKLDRQTEAEESLRQALGHLEKLVSAFQTVPSYRATLATCQLGLGELLHRTSRQADAEEILRRALAVREKLADDFPTVFEYRRDLASSHDYLALMLLEQKNIPDAEVHLRRAFAIKDKLVTEFPSTLKSRLELAGGQINFGGILSYGGKKVEALEWFGRAIASLTAIREAEPRATQASLFLRNAHFQRAVTLESLGRFADAIQDWDRAVELSSANAIAETRAWRAVTIAHYKDIQRALTEAADIEKSNIPPDSVIDLARIYSMAAEHDVPNREQHVRDAIRLVRRALKLGFRDLTQLKTDEDLKQVRERRDFQELLAEFELKKDSTQKPN